MMLHIVWTLVLTPDIHATTSVLTRIRESSKSVVKVTAEAGGLEKTPTESYLIKETGQIINRHKARALYHRQSGGGVIVDPSGIIVTNAHIVKHAMRITVSLPNGTEMPASMVHAVPAEDLVFLKIPVTTPLPAVRVSDSDRVSLNMPVYAVGNSVFLNNTISEGRITGLGQKKHPRPDDPKIAMLRINFRSYPGDSGSPVLSGSGELLGMTVAGKTQGGDATFAIPSNLILKALRAYKTKKEKNQG